jgi:hypothetical protein
MILTTKSQGLKKNLTDMSKIVHSISKKTKKQANYSKSDNKLTNLIQTIY